MLVFDSTDPRLEEKELGEIDMASRALAAVTDWHGRPG
jgi:hypothetical protein